LPPAHHGECHAAHRRLRAPARRREPVQHRRQPVRPDGRRLVGFTHQFTSGLCNAPIIGASPSLLPDIQQFATDGTALADPDGGGG
jgi:hypothetical protein